ncbi:MAG: class I SAM-dependent methyltransferase [Phycisphaerales bacterium]|nr:class I SAM-dependent methyltransferase [Phycisphaerales bacterium]
MRTDYFAHDGEYRRRRAAGGAGWDTAEQAAETIAVFEDALAFEGLGVAGQGRRLVEFGCGAGNLMLHFAEKGWQVAGVDISPFAVDWAKERLAAAGVSADLVVADVTREITWSSPAADVVIDGHCLHCLIGADRAVFFSNARKVLKPGGTLIIHTMCGDPVTQFGTLMWDPATRCHMYKDIAIRYFGTPESLTAEVVAAGFHVSFSKLTPARDSNDQDCMTIIAITAANPSRQ